VFEEQGLDEASVNSQSKHYLSNCFYYGHSLLLFSSWSLLVVVVHILFCFSSSCPCVCFSLFCGQHWLRTLSRNCLQWIPPSFNIAATLRPLLHPGASKCTPGYTECITEILGVNKNKEVRGTKFNIVATRCHILRLKCIKFDFGWGSDPDRAELTP